MSDSTGLLVPDGRGSWVRTWHNVDTNGGGGLLRNTPDGWVKDGDPGGGLWWRGSDQLGTLLMQSSGGYRRIERDGIVYTIPTDGGNPTGMAAVGRATSLIADTLSGLPWRVVRDNEVIDEPWWLSDPQQLRPDARMTRSLNGAGANPLPGCSFWSQVIISQLWAGFAVLWAAAWSPDGTPASPLVVLNPGMVTIRAYPRDGKEAGVWLDNADGGPVRLDPSEVIIVPGEGPYDSDGVAEGLIRRYARLLGLASVIQAYSVGTFTAGVPSGFLKSTNPNLTEQQASDLRSKWEAAHGGGQRGIAVLNSAVDFQPISFSPVDAALIESGYFTTAQIALAFGLEPWMLGVPGTSDTYANIVDRQQHFVTFTLLPWARRIEDTLSALFPRGTQVQIDMRGLLRGDTASRYAGYQIALQNGWLTVDEIRRLEDLGPLPATPVEEGQTDDQAA